MSTGSTQESAAYQEAVANKAALGHELFELLVKEEWYGMLTVALQKREQVDGASKYSCLDVPDFSGSVTGRGYNYIGCWNARQYKSKALGEPLGDDRFQELVEEVLKDELEKHNIELRLETRHNWDGSDQVFRVYPRS